MSKRLEAKRERVGDDYQSPFNRATLKQREDCMRKGKPSSKVVGAQKKREQQFRQRLQRMFGGTATPGDISWVLEHVGKFEEIRGTVRGKDLSATITTITVNGKVV